MAFKTTPLYKAIIIFFRSWLIALTILLFLYFLCLREWQMTWGATTDEVSHYMVGDELLQKPEFNATRAVKIKAPPEKVWPWIVQMGYKRAGFYAFDKLDNGGLPSAECLIPEYQNLTVGDSIPLGGSFIKVVEMKPNHSMLWIFLEGAGSWTDATWSWRLYKADDNHTRLVTRLRQKYTFDSLQETIMWTFIDVFEIFMMRTSLLGIKHRVENG